MHDVAETGVAAHWSYKDGVRTQNPFAVDPAKWISQLTEQFDGEDDHEDFLEAVSLRCIQIRCFASHLRAKWLNCPVVQRQLILLMLSIRGSATHALVQKLTECASRCGHE